ncbi:hypothetical protein F2Q70_00009125 [Brassica cretica]|uniref:Uncharacterized protein n=1 Tax=Brassica cretica TaxID=69181 RepID=A0A8S9LX00_BRACR|nr:hypothetical protein F2Q70_00009125 [Brassica cretica]
MLSSSSRKPYNDDYDDDDDLDSDDSLEDGFLDLGSLGAFGISRFQPRSATAITSRGLRNHWMSNPRHRSRGGNRRR